MVVFAYFSGYLDWHAAREACIARGGDLASIQSAADNAAAITLIAGASTTWMGYRCGAKGSCGALDHWNWVDGSPAAYNNWDPNEEHSRPSDACGHFKDTGTWGSLACTGLPELVDGYLCSLPSASQARRHLQIASPPKVIQIGDSWTELSLQTLATFCRGATTVNGGVSSSKAIEWAQGSACPLFSRDRSCSMTEAFSPAHGSGYTHAVLTAGGNDFLDYPGCSMTEANVQSRVTDAINTLRAAAPPGIKIVLVGYCTPTGVIGDCASASSVSPLNAGIVAAANAAPDVTFVDAHNTCGGTKDEWSPGAWHQDVIHLNTKGYCKVWTLPGMQAALGCAPATYDCSIPGKTADWWPLPPPPKLCTYTSGNDYSATDPKFTCRAVGDPHYLNVHNVKFDFYGRGLFEQARFTLARCGCNVVVQAFLMKLIRGWPANSAIGATAIRIGNIDIIVTQGGIVSINQPGQPDKTLQPTSASSSHVVGSCTIKRESHGRGGWAWRVILPAGAGSYLVGASHSRVNSIAACTVLPRSSPHAFDS